MEESTKEQFQDCPRFEREDYFLELSHLLQQDRVVSLYDFGLFQPTVKHLGLTHYAAGRSLALQGLASPLLLLSPQMAKRAMRNLKVFGFYANYDFVLFLFFKKKTKEARLNLLKVLLASPDNVATLILLARVDLFPVCYFVDSGDLHLVEVNIRRAIEHLRLALKYDSSSEISALLVVAASRFLQFCTSHYNAEMSELYETHLASALKRDPHCLDEFFFETLRERNAQGRALLLSQVKAQSSCSTQFSCDLCHRQIVLRGPSERRLRCIVCPDFDVCPRCAARGRHLEHGHSFAEHDAAETRDDGLSGSRRDRRALFAVLAERVRAASRDLTRLSVAETNVESDELAALDLSRVLALDLQGCRRLRAVPTAASVLTSLNVSNCPRLARDAAANALTRCAKTLSELRAKGLVGEWDESGMLADPEALPALTLLDLTRRTFLERLLIHSHSLER